MEAALTDAMVAAEKVVEHLKISTAEGVLEFLKVAMEALMVEMGVDPLKVEMAMEAAVVRALNMLGARGQATATNNASTVEVAEAEPDLDSDSSLWWVDYLPDEDAAAAAFGDDDVPSSNFEFVPVDDDDKAKAEPPAPPASNREIVAAGTNNNKKKNKKEKKTKKVRLSEDAISYVMSYPWPSPPLHVISDRVLGIMRGTEWGISFLSHVAAAETLIKKLEDENRAVKDLYIKQGYVEVDVEISDDDNGDGEDGSRARAKRRST